MKTIKDLIAIAEENDWTVWPCKFGGNITGYEFEKYSDYGQDFTFCVEASNPDAPESVQVLVGKTWEYIEDFDPIEEAMKWIGPDGHGANGAPDDPTDIIADMQDCKNMMIELVEAWS